MGEQFNTAPRSEDENSSCGGPLAHSITTGDAGLSRGMILPDPENPLFAFWGQPRFSD